MPVVSGVVLAIGLGGAVAWFWRDVSGKPDNSLPQTRQAGPASLPTALVFTQFPLMDRAALLELRATTPMLARLADRPAVFIISFPDLRGQGRMMNRLAALLEKAHTPRDRVLDDAALATAIAADGEVPDTYYYGHNYTLPDVERFFAMAHASGVALNADESWLEAKLADIRAAVASGPAAIITLPAESSGFDAQARRTVLEHEAGHGRFFTDQAFADHVMHAWREVFTETDRATFRRFLVREGYDGGIELMMANEAMAYLLFTPDARFFDPARDLGIDAQSAERLRQAMRPPP